MIIDNAAKPEQNRFRTRFMGITPCKENSERYQSMAMGQPQWEKGSFIFCLPLNTQNNYYQYYFTMKPKPMPADLVLHYVKVTPDGRIKLKMSNDGFKIPDNSFNSAWVKATIIGSSPYRQIRLKDMDPKGVLKKGKAGQYVTFTWPDTGPQGIKLTAGYNHTVEVILDCWPRINDANRSNNSKKVTLWP